MDAVYVKRRRKVIFIFWVLSNTLEENEVSTITTNSNLSYTPDKASYWIIENFLLQISFNINSWPIANKRISMS